MKGMYPRLFLSIGRFGSFVSTGMKATPKLVTHWHDPALRRCARGPRHHPAGARGRILLYRGCMVFEQSAVLAPLPLSLPLYPSISARL